MVRPLEEWKGTRLQRAVCGEFFWAHVQLGARVLFPAFILTITDTTFGGHLLSFFLLPLLLLVFYT